jgi:hypothetical protein
MPRREFAGEKALKDYAERIGDFCAFEGSPTFAKWRRLLSPDQYEIVDVRTSQAIRRAILFPKAILKNHAAGLRNALGTQAEKEKKGSE